jgi:transglutaminase-like putative cysteine protease
MSLFRFFKLPSMPTRIEWVTILLMAFIVYPVISLQTTLFQLFLLLGIVIRVLLIGKWKTEYRRGNNFFRSKWIAPQAFIYLLIGFVIWFRLYPGTPSLSWITGLLVLLTIAKLMEFQSSHALELVSKKQPTGDFYTLILLAFFLLFVRTLFDQSIGQGLLIFIIALFILAALWWAHAPNIALFGAFKSMTKTILLAIPVILVLFVLFPRIQNPLWRLPQNDQQKTKTGVSERASLNDDSPLALSEDIAMRVQFKTPRPSTNSLYWRGSVLSVIENGEWKASDEEKMLRRQDWRSQAQGVSLLNTASEAIQVQYEATIDTSKYQWLFPLEHFTNSLDAPEGLTYSRDGQVQTDSKSLIRYSAQATVAPFSSWAHSNALSEEEQQLYLSLPSHSALSTWLEQIQPEVDFDAQWINVLSKNIPNEISSKMGQNPRTRAFGYWLSQQTMEPIDKIQLALQLLVRQGFSYNLEPAKLGLQANDEFLFVSREGYCQHFAISFGFLMRSAGIPTRLVGGYLGGEENPIDQVWLIKERDAHLWVESWVDGYGWVKIDPTAALALSSFSDGLSFIRQGGTNNNNATEGGYQWKKWTENVLTAINHQWDQWILSYTADSQEGWLKRFGFEGGSLNWLLRGILAVMAVALALMAFLLYRHTRSQNSVVDQWMEKVARFFLEKNFPHLMVDIHQKDGLEKKSSETWTHWLTRTQTLITNQPTARQKQHLQAMDILVRGHTALKYAKLENPQVQQKRWIKRAKQYLQTT